MGYTCASCGAPLPEPPWYRRDTCPKCDADLRACVNCDFFAPGHYNECREEQAERVAEKDRATTCDYFRPSEETQVAAKDNKSEALAELNKLFKK
ncbi:MAG: hypothetical protein C0609_00800 [Deltaproteobacteria bacterium]|nr:MAG: hypothetical protein C0609_00800 [Deltaproteobacteria bacterium]